MSSSNRWMVGLLVALVIGLAVALVIVIGDDDSGEPSTTETTLPTVTEQPPQAETVVPTTPSDGGTGTDSGSSSGGVSPP